MDTTNPSEHVMHLAEELQELLQKYILMPPDEVADQMQRAAEIRQEIESLGYPVAWEVQLDHENPEESIVIVNVYKVKENLPPEDQKIYDEWFMKVARIKK